ncbi:hypothetical protein N7513_007290 [Penicillium frequentans]|nr:hypothetical protein N7513_007290 [Penicillium glabrum]
MPSNDGFARAELRYIPLSYCRDDSENSARKIILNYNPEWENPVNKIEIVQFANGLTNTVLKVLIHRPELTNSEVENEALLIRAYGDRGALIDREEEINTHLFLAQHDLATPLLARFENGLLYPFVPGRPCEEHELFSAPVFRGIARHLAKWHAVLPRISNEYSSRNSSKGHPARITTGPPDSIKQTQMQTASTMWEVMANWISKLPDSTQEQCDRRLKLQKELSWMKARFNENNTTDEPNLVFTHGDLIPGNIIILPGKNDMQSDHESEPVKVRFIDYECAGIQPAAFEIASFFYCWIGTECDYTRLPTRTTRRQFLAEYAKSYCERCGLNSSREGEILQRMCHEVDRYRGIPGFYWALWGFVHSLKPDPDFDSASYGEKRLLEYYAWKEGSDGSRQEGEKPPLCEQQWARE